MFLFFVFTHCNLRLTDLNKLIFILNGKGSLGQQPIGRQDMGPTVQNYIT